MSSNADHPQARQVVLANGLRLTLVHDPRATRAAALARVAAGSHDEPPAHPGLAHFLEHLLFLGGEHFEAGERLMPWVQARGGRLNASTQARTTDYFFEVVPAELDDGVARLVDMLAHPRLDVTAQLAEREVLEAEYIARAADARTLIDAALAASVAAGHPLRRFVAGRRDSLAVADAAFQSALRGFHDNFYQPGNLQLWLHGPQSYEELEGLALRHFADWPTAWVPERTTPPPLAPQAEDTLHLCLPGAPRLVLGFALGELDPVAEQTLESLAKLLADEAAGGLMAWLAERGLCDTAALRVAYRAPGQALLVATFDLAAQQQAMTVEKAFLDWLGAVCEVGGSALVVNGLGDLSPLDQLFQRARGLPARVSPEWLATLQASPPIRLLITPTAVGHHTQIAGFTLRLERQPAEHPDFTRQAWRFPAPRPPSAAAVGSIQLRWRFPSVPARSYFLALRQGLRPVLGMARRDGVSLRLDEEGGDWTLGLQGPEDRLAASLDSALALLTDLPGLLAAQGDRLLQREREQKAAELPIRRLLDALAGCLAGPGSSPPDWSSARWDMLLRNAAPPAGPVPGLPAAAPLSPSRLESGRHHCPVGGEGEAALLLFCPLPGTDPGQEAAWRLMARELEGGFYQRLRVELKLGYALYCGFRQVAGWRGLVFAVQSPHAAPDELLAHVQSFLQDAASKLYALPESRLRELANSLADQPVAEDAAWRDHLSGVGAGHWQAVEQSARQLRRSDLLAAHAALLSEQGGWWILTHRD